MNLRQAEEKTLEKSELLWIQYMHELLVYYCFHQVVKIEIECEQYIRILEILAINYTIHMITTCMCEP